MYDTLGSAELFGATLEELLELFEVDPRELYED